MEHKIPITNYNGLSGKESVSHYNDNYDDSLDSSEERIARRVVELLLPNVERVLGKNAYGVLYGIREIAVYLRVCEDSEWRIGKYVYWLKTFKKWMDERGFRMSKNHKNKWWISKAEVDRWMAVNGIIMQRAAKMGMWDHKPFKSPRLVFPSRLPEEKLAEVVASLNMDKVKANAEVGK